MVNICKDDTEKRPSSDSFDDNEKPSIHDLSTVIPRSSSHSPHPSTHYTPRPDDDETRRPKSLTLKDLKKLQKPKKHVTTQSSISPTQDKGGIEISWPISPTQDDEIFGPDLQPREDDEIFESYQQPTATKHDNKFKSLLKEKMDNIFTRTGMERKDIGLGEVTVVTIGGSLLLLLIVLFIASIVLSTFYLYLNPILLKNDNRRNITIGLLWVLISLGFISAIIVIIASWDGEDNIFKNLISSLILVSIPFAAMFPAERMLQSNKENFSTFERIYLPAAIAFGVLYPEILMVILKS